jgi:hypothetical protein
MSISVDEKEFACVSGKYIVVYSFEKICGKVQEGGISSSAREDNIAAREVIYTGRDSNLVYCEYVDKGLLLVATTSPKKY